MASGVDSSTDPLPGSDAPLQQASFSIERLEEFARELALSQPVVESHPAESQLWQRFESNAVALETAYKAIAAAVAQSEEITPGADWLLDNFYIVREQLSEIREDLPQRYYRELPKLSTGELAGHPRIYSLAVQIIAHTDSTLDDAILTRFLKAYQELVPLTMGEVWAAPIMLRLGLVENLRRLADRIVDTQEHRRCANAWADEIIDNRPADSIGFLAERTKSPQKIASPLVAHLDQRFRDQGHDLAVCWHWLDQHLADQGESIEEVIHHEHHRQASDQVSTGNAITSMRLISAWDWHLFFEEINLTERELRRDPAGVYSQMDFATRDRYRHQVETLARRSKRTELDVASHIVAKAQQAPPDDVRRHIGYYLVDEGHVDADAELRVRLSIATRLRRALSRRPERLYLGGVLLLTLLAIAAIEACAWRSGSSAGMLLLIGLVVLLPASEIGVAVVNYLATRLLEPHVLPRMDFRAGIPASCLTAVVVPTLLSSEKQLQSLLQRLEIHYLGNSDPEFTFVLLTDFVDAPRAEMPEDAALLAAAVAGVEHLNARYAGGKEPKFWLFHRARRWNAAEAKWMGWERKRGKLSEFNWMLRGALDTSYVLPQRAPAELRDVRYVITLDGDTQLPLGAARQLVSTLAHPLNKARIAHNQNCVERGYSILQPRIQINPLSANRTLFARIFSGNPHLDPYVTAVSDVYQDCFGEGSFTGKGIYDLDAFETTLATTFPENHILSHDLIEGCHARAALVTDVLLIDDIPAQYFSYARRQHRWVRGDWQLLPWLFFRVPTTKGPRPNPLAIVSRWKIVDNLRRSLVPPALVLMFVLGWLVLPGAAWAWTAGAILVLALPLVMHLASVALGRPRGLAWRLYLRDVGGQVSLSLMQTVCSLAFLPHQAYLMLDAILRTLIRVGMTRRNLLEWETAYATEGRARGTLRSMLREMWIAPVCAVVSAVMLAVHGPASLFLGSSPIWLLWLISPAIAHFISRPRRQDSHALSPAERRGLRLIARRTWLFFETFVTAEDHWLPPDNFQEEPRGVIAHRTSPTNEGMYLVSALAAHDFGFIGISTFVECLERNLASWDSLEHFRGHPYNWYDTERHTTLMPAYISTVDSGNLAASALTVRQGLVELERQALLDCETIPGLGDTAELLQESLEAAGWSDDSASDELLGVIRTGAEDGATNTNIVARHQTLAAIATAADRLHDAWASRRASSKGLAGIPQPVSNRLEILRKQIAAARDDLLAWFPWLKQLGPQGFESPPQWPSAGVQANGWKQTWQAISNALDAQLTLAVLADLPATTNSLFDQLRQSLAAAISEAERRTDALHWINEFQAAIAAGAAAAAGMIARIRALATRLKLLADAMDFTFLYDSKRRLFAIGYNHTASQLDRGRYDLLASEARLAGYLAIGKGDVDFRHWFHLGRPLTFTAGKTGLLSWGGTMFEYLMPNLFLRSYPETLLDEACQAAVDRQIEFGEQRRVPWGISESAFSTLDGGQNYQYQSFGVPGLGLKRGLADDLVVAPYATGLALAVRPHAAIVNFQALAAAGAAGPWGFYESLDYTPKRLASGQTRNVVRCYFAHHQGMLLTAVANCLLNNRMRDRFHREPATRTTELLLEERIPLTGSFVEPHGDEAGETPVVREADRPFSRWLTTPQTYSPRTHLISNGQYTAMVTNAGTGFSMCQATQITRWRSDTICDPWGQFIYLRDTSSGKLWSAGFQPVRQPADDYDVLFSVDKAEITRRDGGIESHLEIAISPDHNVEVRMLTLTNRGQRAQSLDVTSYGELVLATAEADAAHPAFQKLFIETEFVAGRNALLASRRLRSAGDSPQWAVHVLALESDAARRGAETTQFESDRARFLGRGRSTANPAAMAPGVRLSGTAGPVLDPIFSLRTPVLVAPGKSVRLAFSTGLANSREGALALADQYHDLRVVQRAFELAWAQAQVELRHAHLSTSKVHLFQRLGAMLLYPDFTKRSAAALVANRSGQPALWRYGISGDYPILLARISEANQDGLVRELLLAHDSWRAKNFIVELVILNEHPTAYSDAVQDRLQRLLGESTAWSMVNKRGGIFILPGGRVPEEDRNLLQAAAHVVLVGKEGSLEKQLDQPLAVDELPPLLDVRHVSEPSRVRQTSESTETASQPARQFDNGLGGFTPDGREYVIQLVGERWTPAPWSNVIANAGFGCVVTEAGCGSTWAENSRENRLTSWSNDPVSDPPSEAVYLRDEETGELWSPTPLPIRETTPYTCRHGQGYTSFQHSSHGIDQQLLITIAADDPLKILQLKLRNNSGRLRELSVTYCVEWVLGVQREQTQLHVVTEIDQASGALLASNHFNQEFGSRVAFLQLVGRPISYTASYTADRREFFGRNGTWTQPAALDRIELSGRVGPGCDPCGAMQTKLRLGPGEQTTVVFLLGQAANREELERLLADYKELPAIEDSILASERQWDETLGQIQVGSPNPALNLLLNRWLLYQTLSCRFWGRTAFYQSGGAYGFRDQLQDSMALVYSRPDLARQHILRAASRQFEEGDVQHWWHPPSGRGVRTRISDDLLWLPFVTAHYIEKTGDRAILDAPVNYLRSPPLLPQEHERYEHPEISTKSESLYAHCVRALRHAEAVGAHALPLMGAGDWNDGMNEVGAGGRGESVWLAWFLSAVQVRFAPLAEIQKDPDFAAELRRRAKQLRAAAEAAWDGAWYRRAYFDDGTPLGSAQNDACQIDSIAQSWAVLAGGNREHAAAAMGAVEKQLVEPDQKLVRLLWPPFDKTKLEPGYIKGYLPGVRENGGQYTHAALWVVQALAQMGSGDRAMEVFDILNPIHHGQTDAEAAQYRTEPYAVAADIYSLPPHTGRGGWTWYTGSAAWMYRVALEDLLGFKLRAEIIKIEPCIPSYWPEFSIMYRHRTTNYQIVVKNPERVSHGVRSVMVDDVERPTCDIPILADGRNHRVQVTLGRI